MAKFLKIFKNEEGATAIEYGLIAALIAVAAIAALSSIGTQLKATFNTVATSLSSANAGSSS
jgi:pilus assembly protein Flp/PilA